MNAERQYIAASLENWDTVTIQGVDLPCIFDFEYVEVLESASRFPVARVAEHQVAGENPDVPINVDTRVDRVMTFDGREIGPFIVKVIQHDDVGYLLLVLESV